MLPRSLKIALALCALVPAAAHGQTQSAIVRGQAVAERSCMGCHSVGDQQRSIIQGVVVPTFREIAGRPGQTPQRLQSFIMTPHRPMPGTTLTLAEANDVVAFLLSLK